MVSTGIGVLGPLTVGGSGGRVAPRDRVVLTALALRAGEVVSAERLADALWGDQPPSSWKKVVPGCVMRLRRTLGADVIETLPDGYRLVMSGDEIDAQHFERLVDRARQLLTLGQPERAAHMAAEALTLWRGRPLGDLEGWDPGRIEAARLEELRLDAEELHLDAALQAGRYREVLGEAHTQVAEAPLRERRWALLATAQYQAGRQGEALRTLHGARTSLATELGVDPGPELLDLEQAILRQDPSLVACEAGPDPPPACPYPGLVPYGVGDADGFFGRDNDVTQCLHRIATVGVLAVVGPSGSGKSSLVRAGVAAALVRDGRRVVIVTPGAHPLEAVSAVDGAGPYPVLVVDQCEQVVTLCSDAGERSRFFAALADHAMKAPVVVAVRADRLGDATAQPEFARLVELGLHLLCPMAEPELRAAIEGPAHQTGLLLEAGLVDLLVREVEGEPGALPLLSHALRETWERREGRALTVAGYQASGGIRAALARTAEEVYQRVPLDRRADLRELLLRLVESSDDGDPVSTPVPRRSLVTDPEHDHLLDLLVDARLVTSDDGVVALSHESLARAWPRLRGWLDDDTEGQRILRHLAGAADAWDSMGRPDDELYRGVRLHTALEWHERTPSTLTTAEHDFLDDARRHADAEARQEHRTTRRRRGLVTAVALLSVAALVAGLMAVLQAERAEESAVIADSRRAIALSRDVDAVDTALLMAVEAVKLQDSDESRNALLEALSRSPALIRSYRDDTGNPASESQPVIAARPDGKVVIAGDGTSVAAHDAETLDVVHRFDGPIQKVVWGPNGDRVAVATPAFADGRWGPRNDETVPVRLLDGATLEPASDQLGGWPEGDGGAWDLDYSADGRRLAADVCVMHDWFSWDFSCTVAVWDMATPERPVQRIPVGRAWGVALSSDGSRLYVGTYEPALEAYDVASGARLGTTALTLDLQAGNQASSSSGDTLEISPDGTTIALRADNDVVLMDALTLTERARIVGHTALVQAVAFSRDGTLLASSAEDGTIVVWDVATGLAVEHLRGHTEAVRALEFGLRDDTLYSVAADGRLFAWDLRGDRRFIARLAPGPTHDESGSAAIRTSVGVPAPDGEVVAHMPIGAAPAPTLRFFDVAAGRLGPPIPTTGGLTGPSWRPPAFDEFAGANSDGFVRVWDWRRGALIEQRQLTTASIVALTYTSDGGEIVAIDDTPSIHRVDADTLEPTAEPIPLDDDSAPVVGEATLNPATDWLTVGPDGRTAVALLAAGTSAWVDLAEGRMLRQGDLGLEPARAWFSPDGRRLAVAANSGQVGLFELDTWAWIRPPVAAHSEWALGVTWAPDGSVFASSGVDGRVSLWDGRTGDRIATVLPSDPGSWPVASFLRDGHTLIVATTDQQVFTWDTRPESWVERACQIAGRDLTPDEWSDAFGDRPHHRTCAPG